ncbi:MAG: glycine--tRNA ligase subunit beta [Pseudomonadota bacterium]
MPELLLEIFSEEIPARMQRKAAADLQRLVGDGLCEAGYSPVDQKVFSTPRRLTLVVANLPSQQEDRRDEKKGPRVGAPEKAVAGFLKSAGLSSIDEAEVHEDKKGQFYVAVVEQKGRSTASVIADLIPKIISQFPWPKSMRWGDSDLKWVRPLHRILCTFDGEVVPFEVQGIVSADVTEGHRFIAPAPIQARNFDAYADALSGAHVMLDPDVREEKILNEARGLAAAQGFELIEDKGLLAEVAGLAEWPVARIGKFDEKFLTVPDEALTASMKGHQKYFSVRDPNTGRLAPRFICVANVEPDDGGAAMMTGYERVLEARLSDAWFLYRQDLKKPLAQQAEKLANITFFKGLGSVADKVERVASLARTIAPLVAADPAMAEKAARLAKADLVTEMVGEFPELQGLMGRYYALEEGVEPAIADALRDHYKPAGQKDEIPSAPVSVAVALAEKLATLMMFWSIDEKPTGSKDPFALRRAALGAVQLILANDVRLPLAAILSDGLDGHQAQDLMSFIHDRFSVFLRDKGHRHDHISAVLGADQSDLVLVAKKLEALEGFLKTDGAVDLTAAYKRAGNILKAEAKKGELPGGQVDAALLIEPAEKALGASLGTAQGAAAGALKQEDFAAAMAALANLRGPLDTFFEAVTVNADDAALRANRLSMLVGLERLGSAVADLSKVEG